MSFLRMGCRVDSIDSSGSGKRGEGILYDLLYQRLPVWIEFVYIAFIFPCFEVACVFAQVDALLFNS